MLLGLLLEEIPAAARKLAGSALAPLHLLGRPFTSGLTVWIENGPR